jgi:hypothetical protein
MKPRVSASSPPISVGDDDDDDDGANDVEEEDSVDRTIGRSAGQHALRSIKRAKGAMVLDLDSAWETELEKIRIPTCTQHRALHARHAPVYTRGRLAIVPVARRVWPVSTRMQDEAE